MARDDWNRWICGRSQHCMIPPASSDNDEQKL